MAKKKTTKKAEQKPEQKKPLDNDYWQTSPSTVADALRLTGLDSIVLDACAKDETAAKAPTFISEEDNALAVDWMDFIWDDTDGKAVWCNPPFSQKVDFLEKCYQVSVTHNLPVIALVPYQGSTNWWFNKVVFRAEKVFVPRGRIRFIDPETGEVNTSPREPTCLVYFSGRELDEDHAVIYQHYERTLEVDRAKPE